MSAPRNIVLCPAFDTAGAKDAAAAAVPPVRVVWYKRCSCGCGRHLLRYRGLARRGLPHGHGQRFYADGVVYTGDWVDGKRHGYGELTEPAPSSSSSSSSAAAETSSPCTTSSRSSPCSRIAKGNGSSKAQRFYAGDWKDDRRDGFGFQWFDRRSHYEGQWKDGKRHGYGRMRYVHAGSSCVYEGEWLGDSRHGSGTFHRSEAEADADEAAAVAEGVWSNGNMISGVIANK